MGGLLYNGAEVRIAADRRVWVLVESGVLGAAARWKPMPHSAITLRAALPDKLITPLGQHSLADLGIDAPEAARVLGLPLRG